jgi:hypothetical protein
MEEQKAKTREIRLRLECFFPHEFGEGVWELGSYKVFNIFLIGQFCPYQLLARHDESLFLFSSRPIYFLVWHGTATEMIFAIFLYQASIDPVVPLELPPFNPFYIVTEPAGPGQYLSRLFCVCLCLCVCYYVPTLFHNSPSLTNKLLLHFLIEFRFEVHPLSSCGGTILTVISHHVTKLEWIIVFRRSG